MDELLTLFSVLSDRTRLRILLLLQEKELCVCEIFGTLAMSQPRISRQLAMLKQAGLIKDKKDGKWVYYRINDLHESEFVRNIITNLPHWLANDNDYLRDKERLVEILRMLELQTVTCACLSKGDEQYE